MSDIFLSYAHEDQARIQQLAQALEAQGWTVFWDRTLSAGSTWRDTIGKALETAGCVVVAWSRHSIISHWVCEEAEEGQERNILVPVFFDNVKPPLGFRSIHAANLAQWDGSTDAEAFRHLVSSIMRVIGTPEIQAQPTPPVQEALADRQADLQKISKKLRPYTWLLLTVAFVGLAGWFGFDWKKQNDRSAQIEQQFSL